MGNQRWTALGAVSAVRDFRLCEIFQIVVPLKYEQQGSCAGTDGLQSGGDNIAP